MLKALLVIVGAVLTTVSTRAIKWPEWAARAARVLISVGTRHLDTEVRPKIRHRLVSSIELLPEDASRFIGALLLLLHHRRTVEINVITVRVWGQTADEPHRLTIHLSNAGRMLSSIDYLQPLRLNLGAPVTSAAVVESK